MFYAFTNDIPFQSEPCPHMNEGVRTEIREFLNALEGRHAGVKNGLYQSVLKVSAALKSTDTKKGTRCVRCGNESTGETCSCVQRIAGTEKMTQNLMQI